jgi:hypothetical protein
MKHRKNSREAASPAPPSQQQTPTAAGFLPERAGCGTPYLFPLLSLPLPGLGLSPFGVRRPRSCPH